MGVHIQDDVGNGAEKLKYRRILWPGVSGAG